MQDDPTTLDRGAEAIADAGAWLQPRLETVWTWLREEGPEQALGLVAIVGLFLVLRLARAFLAGVLRSRKAPETAARNVAARLIASTWSLFLLVLSATAVAPFIPGAPPALVSLLERAAQVLLILQGAIWLRQLVRAFTRGLSGAQDLTGGAATAVSLITTVSSIVIWALASIMVLNAFGVEIGPLLAGLGVGGLAVGLAAQNLFKDLFASLAIVFDKPFSRGDWIAFDDGAFIGAVEHVGAKTTRLRSLTGEQIIIGNSQLLDKELRNYQRLRERRVAHEFGVLYQTPHEKLRRVPEWANRAVSAVGGARFDRCHLKSYGDSGVVFELVFWAETHDYTQYMDIQEAVLLNIHAAFEEAGVEFAYPTRTVHIAGGKLAPA